MTAEQIRKLAAAGLTVEQIAVVAEVMVAPKPPVRLSDCAPDERRAILDGFIKAQKEGALKQEENGLVSWPVQVPKAHDSNIETKVQHGELTVWPEKPNLEGEVPDPKNVAAWAKRCEAYVKAYNEENRP